MKYLAIISILLVAQCSSAQKSIIDLLKNTDEFIIHDSILINYDSISKTPLDDLTGQGLLRKIYHDKNLDTKYRNYGIGGKITSNKDFDILIFLTNNKVVTKYWESYDPIPIQYYMTREIFFVLFDKNRNYKNSFLVAMNFTNVNDEPINIREITSWVYNDLKIIQQYRIELKQDKHKLVSSSEVKKPINFSMEYRINDYGVFVAYPKYAKN